MSLSFIQEPYSVTLKGQQLIFTAFETSSLIRSQPGFRYKFTFTFKWQLESQEFIFYVPPNPNGYSDMNLRTVADRLSKIDETYFTSEESVHIESLNAWFFGNYNNYILIEADVEEAWDVDGVLTDSPTSPPAAVASSPAPSQLLKRIFAGAFQANQGYKPSLDTIRYSGNDVWVLTARNYNNWKLAGTYGLEDATAIPVNEDSWGCWAMLNDNAIWDEIRYQLFDSDGVQIGSTADIGAVTSGTDANDLVYAPVYPKTVSANFFLGAVSELPDSTNDWAYYTFEFLLANTSVSKKYAFYKVCDTRYDNVHIGFTNALGGWDYFDFTAKSTPSFRADRKRYKKVLGDYGGDGYDHKSWDRGMTDFSVELERFIEVTASNLRNEDFALLVDLVRSDNVQIIPDGDDSKVEGVILENASYIQEVIKRGEVKDLTLRFRYANNQW